MKTKKKSTSGYSGIFEKISARITRITGSAKSFITALAIVIIWAASGPFFNFSDTWQLVINTSTTIVTFLMVFIIQQSQNKDTIALQLKLNELIASNSKASNRLVAIEELTDDELQVIKKFYMHLSKMAEKEIDLHQTHSLDEARDNHSSKAAQAGGNSKTRRTP